MTDNSFIDPVYRRWSNSTEISPSDMDALSALPWDHRSFGREAYLEREGERTTTCTLLVTGFAFRQKQVKSGSRQIISIHIPGEFLDIQNCLLRVADHNVQSLGRSTVAVVPSGALIGLMNERENIRRAIWRDSLIDASIFREWVVNVGRRDARTRIAHLLCELSDRLKTAGFSDGSSFAFPLTQEHIADCTGMTAVHTNRTLQGLRKDGLISLAASELRILNWDALADVGDFDESYLHHGEWPTGRAGQKGPNA